MGQVDGDRHPGVITAASGEWQHTACILCECNCGVVVRTSPAEEGRRILKIRGDKDHPASQGYTCNKALVEVSDAMLPGHASLPNEYGVDFTGADGRVRRPGVAPNDLTSTEWREVYAGTPWHKHVPARIEAVATQS